MVDLNHTRKQLRQHKLQVLIVRGITLIERVCKTSYGKLSAAAGFVGAMADCKVHSDSHFEILQVLTTRTNPNLR